MYACMWWWWRWWCVCGGLGFILILNLSSFLRGIFPLVFWSPVILWLVFTWSGQRHLSQRVCQAQASFSRAFAWTADSRGQHYDGAVRNPDRSDLQTFIHKPMLEFQSAYLSCKPVYCLFYLIGNDNEAPLVTLCKSEPLRYIYVYLRNYTLILEIILKVLMFSGLEFYENFVFLLSFLLSGGKEETA